MRVKAVATSQRRKRQGSVYASARVLPSSSPLLVAASTALSTMPARPDASKLSSAAWVVPLGLVTFLRSCAGVSADSSMVLPAPKHVCLARRVACSSESPRRVALATRCSTMAKKYAGPEPMGLQGWLEMMDNPRV